MSEIADYIVRMRRSWQFSHFGIEPRWVPGARDIDGFCHDEVVRQGHDTRVETDGGVRVRGMLRAWRYAQTQSSRSPDVIDVQHLAQYIEPGLNRVGDFRRVNVRIGNRSGARPGRLLGFVSALTARSSVSVGPATWPIDEVTEDTFIESLDRVRTVDDWYLAFEWIHPFADGNGRTGKVLHNWLGGTLHEPVLVPDYFGGGNP